MFAYTNALQDIEVISIASLDILGCIIYCMLYSLVLVILILSKKN